MLNIKRADFNLTSEWYVEKIIDKKKCCSYHRDQHTFLIDKSTGREYLSETQGIVRCKCIQLSLGTPFLHPLFSIANVVYRVFKIIFAFNFWFPRGEDPYDLKGRLKDTGIDLIRIVLTVPMIIVLELSSIYGCFSPDNGRKLYATMERVSYGCGILAICFQPVDCCKEGCLLS